MKVVTARQMAQIEGLAYQKGASEEKFMEAAGHGIAERVHSYAASHCTPREITLLCGKGNNSADAYVAGTYLLQKGYSVSALQLLPLEETSLLCQKNSLRFRESGGRMEGKDAPLKGILVDGLFGTGFHGKMGEPYASLVRRANRSRLPILAVDIPSGLNGNDGAVEGDAIVARETLFLELPKRGFFLQQGWNYVGGLHGVDFGLGAEEIASIPAELTLLTKEQAALLLPAVKPKRHKYEAGLVVGIAGSPGMPGAALLSSSAALKGGAGLVHLLHPKGMEAELSNSPYELIKFSYDPGQPEQLKEKLGRAKALFIGPGIGRGHQAAAMLSHLLPAIDKPCVIDADALYLIGTEKLPIPPHAIITPHTGEMQTLLGQTGSATLNDEYLLRCQQYVESSQTTLILKGGPSFIFSPGQLPVVNPFGNPGMATGGTGDVLTGILAALLAQGLTPREAALLGAYLHSRAGDLAAQEKSCYSLIASDLLHDLPKVFNSLLT